jgi:hypothetical protein
MAHPAPPHVQSAQAQVAAALQQVEGKPVDLLKVPWTEIEASIPKLLGGPFQVDNPNHQGLALGLAGAFAERMFNEHGAFWFPNRDSPEGATLGFPDAIIMLSPFGAVMESMAQGGKLSKLEDLAADIRRSLGQARFAPGATQSLGATGPKMGPEEYRRLFDPGFLQFVVLDAAKAKSTFESKPDALARDVREALGRTQPPLPQEARQQFEGQIVQSLTRLDAAHPLSDQMDRAPRIAELMGHLFATIGGTGAAPEEFWGEIVLPLLFIGSPASFPPVDEEETQAFTQGAPTLALFVDVVPHAVQAPEEGLLGTFEQSDLTLEHPGFGKVGALRLIKVNAERIRTLLEQFDPDKTVDAVRRFTKHMEDKAGKGAPPNPQNEEMLKAAMVLLGDLKRAVTTEKGDLCLRRLTEAEAASEQAVSLVRKALQGPRIILS